MRDTGYKILDPLSNSMIIEKKFNDKVNKNDATTIVDKSSVDNLQIKIGELEIKININRG